MVISLFCCENVLISVSSVVLLVNVCVLFIFLGSVSVLNVFVEYVLSVCFVVS